MLEIHDTTQPADGNDSKDVSTCLKYYPPLPPLEYAIRVRVNHAGLEKNGHLSLIISEIQILIKELSHLD